jgi:hypothetical protein
MVNPCKGVQLLHHASEGCLYIAIRRSCRRERHTLNGRGKLVVDPVRNLAGSNRSLDIERVDTVMTDLPLTSERQLTPSITSGALKQDEATPSSFRADLLTDIERNAPPERRQCIMIRYKFTTHQILLVTSCRV